MKTYIEIYSGIVRDKRASHLDYADFCSLWDPSSYWIDVTGVEDVDVGYVIKFDKNKGTYFEKPVITEDENSFDYIKKSKLELLSHRFDLSAKDAYVISSLGFKADANTTANTNVDGLIKSMSAAGTKEITFCDYDNQYHQVSLEDLKTLQLEIIQNGQAMYAQKWYYRDKINSASSVEEIERINIEFNMLTFYKNEVSYTPAEAA